MTPNATPLPARISAPPAAFRRLAETCDRLEMHEVATFARPVRRYGDEKSGDAPDT
jgi:hypothetical protein